MSGIVQLFDTADFSPRWRCGNWSALHGWLHIAGDLLVWGAYMAIPIALAALVLRRRDLPFPRVFWLFGAFIFFCGTVHLIEAVIFWKPIYRFSALVKLMTAAVSWATVFALVPLLPQMLRLPNMAQMNSDLRAEVEQRRATEQRLQETNAQLRKFSEIATGRELRVLDLKREVNELRAQLNREPAYDMRAFEEHRA